MEREEADALIEEALESGLRSVYQPIFDLERDEVVGYEALGRGPAGGPLESPIALLQAADVAGRLDEVDWALRATAVEGALEAKLGSDLKLFVNIEPRCLAAEAPRRWRELAQRAARELQIVAELTERDLAQSPSGLFRTVDAMRKAGVGIAIDDIGDNPRALSMLPLIRPDVVKFRLANLLSDRNRAATLFRAVSAFAERDGTELIVEQIETEESKDLVLGLGVDLGQGFLLGRPSELPGEWAMPARGVRLGHRPPSATMESALAFSSRSSDMRVAREEGLAVVFRHLLETAVHLGPDCSLVVCSPGPIHDFDPLAAAREIAPSIALVCAAAPEAPVERPDTGWHSIAIPDEHPLLDEWVVVVSGTYSSACVCAQRINDGRVRFTVTHREELAVEVARGVVGIDA